MLLARGSMSSKTILHSIRGVELGEIDVVSWSEEKIGFRYLRTKRMDFIHLHINTAQDKRIPIHYDKRIETIKETLKRQP